MYKTSLVETRQLKLIFAAAFQLLYPPPPQPISAFLFAEDKKFHCQSFQIKIWLRLRDLIIIVIPSIFKFNDFLFFFLSFLLLRPQFLSFVTSPWSGTARHLNPWHYSYCFFYLPLRLPSPFSNIINLVYRDAYLH